MSWTAHLNSGPMDDQYIEVETSTFYVVRSEMSWEQIRELSSSTAEVSVARKGHYAMRSVPETGDPIPHDLSGAVEFDWMGWQ